MKAGAGGESPLDLMLSPGRSCRIELNYRPAVRDAGSVPGSGRFPRGGHGNPLQCSCLENPTDRGAWWATVQWVAKNYTQLKRWTVKKAEC